MKPYPPLLNCFFLLVFALSVLLGTTSQAESPDLPPAEFSGLAPAGKRMIWKDSRTGGLSETVVKAPEDFLVKWTVDGNLRQGYARFAPGNVPNSVKPDIEAIWPLTTGKSVSYIRSHRHTQWIDKITVLTTETVTVAAGTFDTYLVQWESRAKDGSWSGQATTWWAPKLGWAVKFGYSDSNGKIWRSEITEIKLD